MHARTHVLLHASRFLGWRDAATGSGDICTPTDRRVAKLCPFECCARRALAKGAPVAHGQAIAVQLPTSIRPPRNGRLKRARTI